MNKDKIKIYSLELLLLFVLFFALFVQNIFTKQVLAIFLLLYMFFTVFSLKKRKILSMYNKQVIILMGVLAFVYLLIFYLLGMYFGFYKSVIKFSWWSVFNYIIPYTVIIISSEVIRHVNLSQKVKGSSIITFISMVLIDLIIYTGVYNLNSLDDFLTVIGFIFFASVSCNLLYNYISNRFGYKPIIIYRLITVLYAYFIPYIPDIYIFFRSVLRMIYPYFIYLILEYSYARGNLFNTYIDKRKNLISTSVLFVVVVLITMLVSCQFKYGILVIGSGSMTGSINIGDAVVFESYKNQVIKEGQVIIFNKDNLQVVHRVVDIKKINGEYRYFTKGDANQKIDDGYVTDEQIVGVSLFKISYIGHPTLWVKEIFS